MGHGTGAFKWIEAGTATPCCGPSLPQTTKAERGTRCDGGGLVPEIATTVRSAFLQRHTIPAYANVEDHDMQTRRLSLQE